MIATAMLGLGWWWVVGAALSLAIAGALALRHVWGTTLVAPAAWWIASALALAAVETMHANRSPTTAPLAASLWRYAAAVGTLCPLMAVLGAKRPQDRGWQWVVLSLWVVLLVPVGQAAAAPAGDRLDLYAPWRIILGALIALGPLNYLPTRFAASALCLAIGQTLLLASFLFDMPLDGLPLSRTMAMAALTAAWLCGEAALRIGRRRPALLAATQRWQAFRDAFGAFWGIRVMQRINQTAELSGWPVRLQWSGFVDRDGALSTQLDSPTSTEIDRSLDALLRRFERL